MAKTLKIKRHDLQPYYRFSIPDSTDLTGASFTCTMVKIVNKKPIEPKILDRVAVGCVITSTVEKECEYRWQAGDTDTEGLFQIEFEIQPQVGGKFTVPVDKPAYVQISADLDGI